LNLPRAQSSLTRCLQYFGGAKKRRGRGGGLGQVIIEALQQPRRRAGLDLTLTQQFSNAVPRGRRGHGRGRGRLLAPSFGLRVGLNHVFLQAMLPLEGLGAKLAIVSRVFQRLGSTVVVFLLIRVVVVVLFDVVVSCRRWSGFVPPSVRCEICGTIEDFVALRASVFHVDNHGASAEDEINIIITDVVATCKNSPFVTQHSLVLTCYSARASSACA